MHSDEDVKDQHIDADVKTKQQQFLLQSIHRWRFLLAESRTQLHAQHWSAAVDMYQETYSLAELLIHIADCKNCAIKNYTRTLFEYGYSLCKNNQRELLAHLIDIARQTLACYVTPTLSHQLLQPVVEMEKANHYQQDLWVNQLFAKDASQYGIVH
mgnify:FL=1